MPSTLSVRHRLPLASDAFSVPGGAAELRGGIEDENADVAEGETSWLQVGELAKLVGKTVRAIHLYEELGLLRPHRRSKGKYRLFDRGAIARARWIGTLQELGLSLGEIQTIVRALEQAPSALSAMQQLQATYRDKLTEAQAQILRWQTLAAELTASLNYLDTCDRCDPARLLDACPACDRHAQEKPAPELVIGFRAGYAPRSFAPDTSDAKAPPVASPADL